MIAIGSLLIFLFLSLLMTRMATIALVYTGMSAQSAKFQARSAITGCGFTTAEAEQVVRHPVRRKIILFIMLLGHVGLVATIAAPIIGFVKDHTGGISDPWIKLGVMVVGLFSLLWLSHSKVYQRVCDVIFKYVMKRYYDDAQGDYIHLCHLSNDYKIAEVAVPRDGKLCGVKLADTDLKSGGMMVLAITRADGEFISQPSGDDVIGENDVLIIYGLNDAINRALAEKK